VEVLVFLAKQASLLFLAPEERLELSWDNFSGWAVKNAMFLSDVFYAGWHNSKVGINFCFSADSVLSVGYLNQNLLNFRISRILRMPGDISNIGTKF
jgi:hypothetical protein